LKNHIPNALFLRKGIVDGLAWQSFDDALSTSDEQGMALLWIYVL
jgi:hypothetical protein